MWANLSRYWHTLRHLRPVQLYGRAWFRLAKPRLRRGGAPARRAIGGGWQMPARREASLTGPGDFLLLGERGGPANIGWDGPQRDRLWRYNQHYFDDLNAKDAPWRADWHRALLDDWVRENPPGHGTGWEPYPTSLRIVNWVKWVLGGNVLPCACQDSLSVQARWLMRRLEFHLLGNHLFANAKALIFAGLFFEGDEARGWMERGLRILAREISEQILPDGGHFERSTMYHALVLEDMLDLCNVMEAFGEAVPSSWRDRVADWRAQVPGMCAWLATMCHPDGEIGFFNDAAIGIAPAPTELLRYADALGFALPLPLAASLAHLRDSGYVRIARGSAVALLDVAPVGPDYLPGHAHADTLSFELSVFGQRVLVNSGTSCYGVSPERARQRGTAAHNTVVVDGENSSEVWAGFRVARRARPYDLQFEGEREESVRISCSHDGYRRLPGRPEHRREWIMSAGGLSVDDHVTGVFRGAEARFHVHPDVIVERGSEAEGGRLILEGGRQVRWRAQGGAVRIEPASWHARFGCSVPSSCIVLALHEGCGRIRFEWD